MGLESGRREINRIKSALAVTYQTQAELYRQLRELEPILHKECKHPKTVYTDGHVTHDPDDYDTPEVRICLSCGLTEQGEREYQQYHLDFGRQRWKYKVLLNAPIRRFCVPGSAGPRGTIEYETRANSTFGADTLEKRLSHYWFHVKDRIFKMPYANRVKAVMKVGYNV